MFSRFDVSGRSREHYEISLLVGYLEHRGRASDISNLKALDVLLTAVENELSKAAGNQAMDFRHYQNHMRRYLEILTRIDEEKRRLLPLIERVRFWLWKPSARK